MRDYQELSTNELFDIIASSAYDGQDRDEDDIDYNLTKISEITEILVERYHKAIGA